MSKFANALPSNEKENFRLYSRVKSRVEAGIADQDRLLDKVSSMVIRDKLVSPKGMRFHSGEGGRLNISYGTEPGLTIHRHALTQLSQKVGIPATYVNFLNEEGWKRDLLALNLNEQFHHTVFNDRSGQPKFLHRIVGTELRGFLSRRFNRHIASAPLLRAFVETCAQVGALPFDAVASDIKVALKCLLPYVFEPVRGQFVCIGVEWSNSDFGAGRMQVALSLWMPQGDRFSVLDHVVSRVHIGSIIEETDVEISEETAKKEAEAQCSVIRDSVVNQLSEESVDRLLKAIEVAQNENITWYALKGQLSRFLSRQDINNLTSALEDEVIDLPPVKVVDGEKTPTKWWASQALSWLANRTDDSEKKLELQHAAGSFLEVK